jgi:hypothetical protein
MGAKRNTTKRKDRKEVSKPAKQKQSVELKGRISNEEQLEIYTDFFKSIGYNL